MTFNPRSKFEGVGTATGPNNSNSNRATMLTPSTPQAKPHRVTKSISQREKEKIVQLFDIEREHHCVIRFALSRLKFPPCHTVESRLKDLRTHLESKLNNLIIYSNNQITRLPPSVRTVTLREFGEKYAGEIHALVRGMASLNVLRNNPVSPSVGKRYALAQLIACLLMSHRTSIGNAARA